MGLILFDFLFGPNKEVVRVFFFPFAFLSGPGSKVPGRMLISWGDIPEVPTVEITKRKIQRLRYRYIDGKTKMKVYRLAYIQYSSIREIP